MSDDFTVGSEQFQFDYGAVLRHKETRELWHVTARLTEADNDIQRYVLWDDTHTAREYHYAKDVSDMMEETGVTVGPAHKPRQFLKGQLYE